MRNLYLFAFIIIFLIPAMPVEAVTEIKSISFPAVSADGKTVYFSAWGDIWSQPRDGSKPARRLTTSVALDARPILSPCGEYIAFVSDRHGNYEIYVMPAKGGSATRLTWDSTVDYPYDWKPDGTAILNYTRRQDHWSLCAYEVNLDGTQPVRLTGPDHEDHVFASYLGSDKKLVFSRGPGDWAKPGWRGSNTYDLWMYDIEAKKYTQLTDTDFNDLWPQSSPDGSMVYFARPVNDCYNLFSYEVATGKTKQLTHFKKNGVLWPRISTDGDEIAFEVHGEMYIYHVKTGDVEKIRIRFADDHKFEKVVDKEMRNNVSEVALSPNGRYYAYVVMGDIFILKNPDTYKDDEKPDQDLSRGHHVVNTPGREMHISWHPEDLKIAYISDRDEKFDVYVLDLVTMEEKQITNTKNDEWYPTFAPHGNKIAYYSGNRQLRLYDLDTEKDELLHEGQLVHGPWILGFDWSPDANWIAFVEGIIDSIADVMLVNVNDKEVINLSFEPDYSTSPSWSPDGKYITFHVSYPDGAEVMLLELDPEKKTFDTKLLFDEDIPEEPKEEEETEEDVENEAEDDNDVDEQPDEDPKEEEEEEDEDKVEPIKIDFDRIQYRAKPLVRMNGDQYSPMFSPGSDYIFFVSNHEGYPEWWTVSLDGRELNKLVTMGGKSAPMFSPDGSRLYFLENNQIRYLSMAGAKSTSTGAVAAKSRMVLDQYQIWDQMLVEGWRRLLHSFYDPNMHGVDWHDVLKRYRPRVKHCGTTYEYNLLYRLMLGELKASHLSFYSRQIEYDVEEDHTGELGVFFDDNWDGPGWKVSKVFLDSPADQPGPRLYEGDIILKINGVELSPNDNRAKVLRNTVGIPLELLVKTDKRLLENEKNRDKITLVGEPEYEERNVTIMPTSQSAMWSIMYEDWTHNNRKYVYEKADERIGYHHIRSMYGSPYLEEFRRDFFTENADKDALIIDIRFNTGGYTAQFIVDMIKQKPFYLHKLRDGEMFHRPPLAWDGPIVLLMNKRSFSNAEIFAHVMKYFDLATLIGEPTGGGVIGTYEYTLLDGASFRIPAWWNITFDGINMERTGAEPHIYVYIDPHELAEGRDNQLDAAIEYLLKKIK